MKIILKLNDNFEYLQAIPVDDNEFCFQGFSMPQGKDERKNNQFDLGKWKNSGRLDQIVERPADKTSEGVENLLNKIFHKGD